MIVTIKKFIKKNFKDLDELDKEVLIESLQNLQDFFNIKIKKDKIMAEKNEQELKQQIIQTLFPYLQQQQVAV